MGDRLTLYHGDCRKVMEELAPGSVQCCITSPPYWGLRDFGLPPLVWGGDGGCDHAWQETVSRWGGGAQGTTGQRATRTSTATGPPVSTAPCQTCGAWLGQLGLEPTPCCPAVLVGDPGCGQCYVCHLVEVMRAVRRGLRDDGTCWIVLGDSFASGKGSCFNPGGGAESLGKTRKDAGAHPLHRGNTSTLKANGLKPKDLCGIPWRVALALQAQGWYLRSAITLCKVNPRPESTTDRPTSATEMMFLLTKKPTYFYDAEAIREPARDWGVKNRTNGKYRTAGLANGLENGNAAARGRNKRNWWPVVSEGFPGAHYATFGTKWIEPAILAGTSARGCCPQCGAGWVRVTVSRGGRDWHQDRMVLKGIPGECNGTGGNKRGQSSTALNDTKHVLTTGWQSGCTCQAGAPVPAVVLDPFAGSGTTGLVALQHGRAFVGIELSPEYLELARKRLANIQGSFISLLERPAPPVPSPALRATPGSTAGRARAAAASARRRRAAGR